MGAPAKLGNRLKRTWGGRKLQDQTPICFLGNGVGWRLPSHPAPKKRIIFRLLPIRGIFRIGERGLVGVLSWRLRTIHPNPGPGGRNKSEEGKAARMERRRGRRKRKREARAQAAVSEVSEVKEITVVAWNVQRMYSVAGVEGKEEDKGGG